jgi:type II secretory pathway component PulF
MWTGEGVSMPFVTVVEVGVAALLVVVVVPTFGGVSKAASTQYERLMSRLVHPSLMEGF